MVQWVKDHCSGLACCCGMSLISATNFHMLWAQPKTTKEKQKTKKTTKKRETNTFYEAKHYPDIKTRYGHQKRKLQANIPDEQTHVKILDKKFANQVR